MIFIVAKKRAEGIYYCQHVASPRLNPNAWDITIWSTSDPGIGEKILGYRLTGEDEVVWYGNWIQGRYMRYFMEHWKIIRATSDPAFKEIHA